LATRVRLAHYVRDQYDMGKIAPLPMRIDPDGGPNRDDIFKYNDPGELLPLAGDRDRTSDTRQLNWYDGSDVHTHSATGFMYYAALVGYSPLYPELADRLRLDLLAETRQYVQTYEVNAPWWWMSDLAHHTTAGGEHLWQSPSLSHDLFQTKAWVLHESWDALRRQLPLPMSINPRYDLYRIDNLATLLALSAPDLSGSHMDATPAAPQQGSYTTLTFALDNTGGPLDSTAAVTITLPIELGYVAGSAQASLGTINANGNTIVWSGTPGDTHEVLISLAAAVKSSAVVIVTVSARLDAGAAGTLVRSARLVLNGRSEYLPIIMSAPGL
ncbi:MAG TPA: hypothetical protein VGJ87_21790, partial [Roseiflexaceae bacterium]